jgi:O-antigen/teichoic acid export membrane protein
MVNVPFSAMYTAKQYIAELTIYGVVTNTCQAVFLYYIASHPSDWLVRYAVWTTCIIIAPQLLICVRAMRLFPECRINLRLCWDLDRLKQLCYFAGSLAFSGLGTMLRGQGVAILVNKYFGATVNAAMSIANSVNAQSIALVTAMQGAFTPAIVQACGAGDDELMRKMAFRACKFGTLLVLIFALPLGLEIENVMKLWLKTPPSYSSGLCLFMLAVVVVDKCSIGHMIAVMAKGRIARYQMFLGAVLICSLPIAWIFVELGFGVYSIGMALFLMSTVCSLGRIWFARKLVKMSARIWL